MTAREGIAAFLEDRARAILAARSEDKIQPHSRQLPTEVELAEAKFAARELQICADMIRQGLDE